MRVLSETIMRGLLTLKPTEPIAVVGMNATTCTCVGGCQGSCSGSGCYGNCDDSCNWHCDASCQGDCVSNCD